MKKSLLSLLISLALGHCLYAQSVNGTKLPFEVRKIVPYISLSPTELQTAETLVDMHPRFPTNWIKEYLSVKVITQQSGITNTVISRSAELNPEQKIKLLRADENTTIRVKVQYLPRNNLKENDPKEYSFSFVVQPTQDAQFVGGLSALRQYLQAKAINKIPEGSFTEYDLAAVQFTVDESGAIQEVQIFESSKNEAVDQLLLETIQNMPCWQPAILQSGRPVAQQFAFTVGNHDNCILNLLGSRRPF
ncbi:MAG TPA: energy transducer TonB [Saprospiraceae bacterium]|nr:energy transducer TonB [Saprospiraceae bacterium]